MGGKGRRSSQIERTETGGADVSNTDDSDLLIVVITKVLKEAVARLRLERAWALALGGCSQRGSGVRLDVIDDGGKKGRLGGVTTTKSAFFSRGIFGSGEVEFTGFMVAVKDGYLLSRSAW